MDREYGKSKKRAEVLQKERDIGRTELSKMVAMKEKMEKLSRELQKEKQKLKVRLGCSGKTRLCFIPYADGGRPRRKRIEDSKKRSGPNESSLMRDSEKCWTKCNPSVRSRRLIPNRRTCS